MPTIEIDSSSAGQRLDVFLTEIMDVSRARIQKLIKDGSITINGASARTKDLLELGDNIAYPEVDLTPFVKTQVAPTLDIVYEDENLLVINKPAGLLVHEALKDEHRATVVDALLELYPEIVTVGDSPIRPGIVHRLDKDVSGLMVIAKTQPAFEHLKQQFQNRTVVKEYLALVYGSLPKDLDTISFKISRSKAKGRMVARTGIQDGKEAITTYEVMRRFSTASYVQVRIHTGRTHQIRVHFQALGYPIVGDKLYKVKNMKFREIPLGRLFLHSHMLKITLLDGQELALTAPLPTELDTILTQLPTL